MSRADRLLRVVKEDLQHLSDTWSEGLPEGQLRRESTILRKLLLDQGGDIQKARKALGLRGHPVVSTCDLALELGDYPLDLVWLLVVGPFKYGGRTHVNWRVTNSERGQDAPPTSGQQVDMDLRSYLAAPAMCLQGRPISRRAVIEYICHRLGGAHVGSRPASVDVEYLDVHSSSVVIDGYDPTYLCLTAIGQALVASADVLGPFGLAPLESRY